MIDIEEVGAWLLRLAVVLLVASIAYAAGLRHCEVLNAAWTPAPARQTDIARQAAALDTIGQRLRDQLRVTADRLEADW